MTVHFMQYGMTACQKPGPPGQWPEKDHRWSSNWDDVTCLLCLQGRDALVTFAISEDGQAITCNRCHYTSREPRDVEHHFCPVCQASHDDLWPPARHWWINHPDPPEYVAQRLAVLKKQ